jgi:hypothetical protein
MIIAGQTEPLLDHKGFGIKSKIFFETQKRTKGTKENKSTEHHESLDLELTIFALSSQGLICEQNMVQSGNCC